MHRQRLMPRWWRYWNFGSGLFLLVAAGALYVAFDPSTPLGYVTLLLFVLAAIFLFLAGLEVQVDLGIQRIREQHFVGIAQLLIGVVLLLSPTVAFLNRTTELYDVLPAVGGLLIILFGFGMIYRPAIFGPYGSSEQS